MIESKFEDWFKSTFKDLHKMVEDGDSIARNHKKALWLGYESRQAEIDNLENRINEIESHVRINYDYEREEDNHSYWSGYNQALHEIKEILGGESND